MHTPPLTTMMKNLGEPIDVLGDMIIDDSGHRRVVSIIFTTNT
jgi:hypothetical protein